MSDSAGRQGFLPGMAAPWEVDSESASAVEEASNITEGVSHRTKLLAPAPAFGPSLLPDNRLTCSLRDIFNDVPPAWKALVDAFAASDPGRALCAFVDERRSAGAEIYPRSPLRALPTGGPAAVRVVILGQDPYHGPGEAEGLAFSVSNGVRLPPSLRNIFKELADDLHVATPEGPSARSSKRAPPQGSLLPWVAQGVLLLNTSLTVERDQPGSHAKRGWEIFTDRVIEAVARDPVPKVFMLWGAHAQAKTNLIQSVGTGRHALMASNHPSPLAARRLPVPFFGSRPFSRANGWLRGQALSEVDWLGGRA